MGSVSQLTLIGSEIQGGDKSTNGLEDEDGDIQDTSFLV